MPPKLWKRPVPPYKEADILRHVAREEPLSITLKAFPGLTRERLTRLLEKMAESTARSPARINTSESSTPWKVRVYSDGAARGNPGPSGAGAVLVDASGQEVDRLGKYLGIQTNNYAEYMGLLLGLKRARDLGIREVEVFADSELMIRQLGGRYQVRSPTLRPLYQEALRVLNDFSRVKLVHVPRKMNAAADEMSNRAIDERM
jgi:ribonuclease HI